MGCIQAHVPVWDQLQKCRVTATRTRPRAPSTHKTASRDADGDIPAPYFVESSKESRFYSRGDVQKNNYPSKTMSWPKASFWSIHWRCSRAHCDPNTLSVKASTEATGTYSGREGEATSTATCPIWTKEVRRVSYLNIQSKWPKENRIGEELRIEYDWREEAHKTFSWGKGGKCESEREMT